MSKSELDNLLGLLFIGIPMITPLLTFVVRELNMMVRDQEYILSEQLRFL